MAEKPAADAEEAHLGGLLLSLLKLAAGRPRLFVASKDSGGEAGLLHVGGRALLLGKSPKSV